MASEAGTDLLVSYYGDDLTGSTDVMEALSSRGVPTALFLDRPTASQRERLGPLRAIGLAGTSRSESPAWMEAHLTPAFAWLQSLGAAICHYKVCSTFDSSPTVGSIGVATDIGARVFAQATVPLVVGAPALRRYTAFGHLFAGYQGRTYRIDRHPVMSRHPVTPMREADLRLHLGAQTTRTVELVSLSDLQRSDRSAVVDAALVKRAGVLMFDVADPASQAAVGEELWRIRRRQGGTFVIGSSGVEYALLEAWTRLGLAGPDAAFESPGAVDRVAVVSGSCSPTTARQIEHALAHGFDGIAVDPRLLMAARSDADLGSLLDQALASLRAGRSVILYTARGPDTDIGGAVEADGGRHAIGRGLGRILRSLVATETLYRAVIAGGDTSSHALRELDVFALKTRLPLPQTPGSPLCTAFSDHPAFDGLEIALKGGQVGRDDYFDAIRQGRAN